MSDITSKPVWPSGEGRPEKEGERERDGEYSALYRAVSLPVIFARFYGNLRIIQLGPGDHFPRYANSTVRPATRRTVLTMVVAGGRQRGEGGRGIA